MLLGTKVALEAAYQQLFAFLSSDDRNVCLHCESDGNPEPYTEFLQGLRISKKSGPLILTLASDRWLELDGSVRNLERYISFFRFQEEYGHHHPEYVDISDYIAPGSMSLIIKVDPEREASIGG